MLRHFGDNARELLKSYRFSENVSVYAWALVTSLKETGRRFIDENDVYHTIAERLLDSGNCPKPLKEQIRESGVLRCVVDSLLIEQDLRGPVVKYSLTGGGIALAQRLLNIKDEDRYVVE